MQVARSFDHKNKKKNYILIQCFVCVQLGADLNESLENQVYLTNVYQKINLHRSILIAEFCICDILIISDIIHHRISFSK